jgi:hypothetical protein
MCHAVVELDCTTTALRPSVTACRSKLSPGGLAEVIHTLPCDVVKHSSDVIAAVGKTNSQEEHLRAALGCSTAAVKSTDGVSGGRRLDLDVVDAADIRRNLEYGGKHETTSERRLATGFDRKLHV